MIFKPGDLVAWTTPYMIQVGFITQLWADTLTVKTASATVSVKREQVRPATLEDTQENAKFYANPQEYKVPK